MCWWQIVGVILLIVSAIIFLSVFTYGAYIERGLIVPFPLSAIRGLNPEHPAWRKAAIVYMIVVHAGFGFGLLIDEYYDIGFGFPSDGD